MHKWLFGLLLLSLPLDASAQLAPHISVFGGYTYVHANYTGSDTGFSLNGWDASLEVKPLPFLGFVADLGKQYGSSNGLRENQTSFLAGPQLSVPGIKGVIPYGHVMVGVIHGPNASFVYCPDIGPFPCPVPQTSNAFATAVGGGVDIKVKGPIWIRAAQVDWVHSNLNVDHHNQWRLATGIVIRFGK